LEGIIAWEKPGSAGKFFKKIVGILSRSGKPVVFLLNNKNSQNGT